MDEFVKLPESGKRSLSGKWNNFRRYHKQVNKTLGDNSIPLWKKLRWQRIFPAFLFAAILGFGAYSGILRFEASGMAEAVKMQISQPDFSIDINISHDYTKITPGMEIPAQITISASGPAVEGDMTYALKNLEGNAVLQILEKKQIMNQDYIKNIPIPADLPEGKYILYASLGHESAAAVASSFLMEYKIAAPAPPLKYPNWALLLLGMALAIMALWLIVSSSHEKSSDVKERIALAKARRAYGKNQLKFANLRLMSRSS